MGHHHTELQHWLSIGFAAALGLFVLGLMAGAAWESHRRKHGRAPDPHGTAAGVAARFAPAAPSSGRVP
jgi:hypothetical protein